MRLVRRRGLAWREAAVKAAAARAQPPKKPDRWAQLLEQLKNPSPCDQPSCRGGHQPGEDHNIPIIRRESRASVVQRAAEQEEEFQGFTNRLLVLLALLLAGLTILVLYTLFNSPTLLSQQPPLDQLSEEQPGQEDS
ncbi:uncharacterized protein [Cherax quadricarinatus]|uniref:uncharacterized protein n=1 Tax=Cherax quadricarinatus TaxID=27406 RepID=UPI002377FB6D|nr:uncharacterized protein LOC128688162 [Cherax quadricarinatus]